MSCSGGSSQQAGSAEVGGPAGGDVGAVEHGAGDRGIERGHQFWFHLRPDVEIAVTQDSLGDRDDHGQFFGGDELVFPVDFGGLLQARVTIHEVGQSQSAHDRHGVGVGAHVCQPSGKTENGVGIHNLFHHFLGNGCWYH